MSDDETKRCGTCVHWSRGENNWGECQRAFKYSSDAGPDMEILCGADDAATSLETTPDFGCVLHEEKK